MSNRFSFVAPIYNASDTLEQMLVSIAAQSYKNWRVILIDDMSSQEHSCRCCAIIDRLRPIIENIEVVYNIEKKWEVANVLKGISMCDDDDIIVRIDGDDYLCDLDALKIINEIYEQIPCDVLWTKHRWFDDKRITQYNISANLPDGLNPYVSPWVSSHMKTFRKRLINDVNDVNFRGEDGEYIKRAGDQCVYLPLLYKSKKRVFLPVVTYAYRCNMDPETFQTDDAKFQKKEAQFLRKRGYVK
jgi:glycosyltransferase involved in cell wall biosynthesis